MSRIKDLLAEAEGIDDLMPEPPLPYQPRKEVIAEIVVDWSKKGETEDYIADNADLELIDDDGHPCMHMVNLSELCDNIAQQSLDELIELWHYDLTDEDYKFIVEHASALIADYYSEYRDNLCVSSLSDYNRDKKYLNEELKEKEGRI